MNGSLAIGATMMSRTLRQLGALASLLLLMTVPAGVQAQTVLPALTAVLQPTQETPPILSSNAFGSAFMTVDLATSMLCYSVTYASEGMPDLPTGEIAAHFHGPARPGVAADVIFDVSPSPSPLGSPKEGCVGPLSSAQLSDLANGLIYLNIHSNDFPVGEIRGQVLLQRAIP